MTAADRPAPPAWHPVSTTVRGWLWLPGRLVHMGPLPAGRWTPDAYRGQR